MSKRLVEETPCEHGYIGQCNVAFTPCHGGSRRVLEPGEFMLVEKVDGEWPASALQVLGDCMFGDTELSGARVRRHRYAWEQVALGILDALAEGEQ